MCKRIPGTLIVRLAAESERSLMMAAYIIARVNVTDWDAYSQYLKRTPRIVKKYHGKFIARGINPEILEGEEGMNRIVIMEFPSTADARAFYASSEYTEVKKYRDGAATAQFILVDGYPEEEWTKVVSESERLP